MWTVVILPSGFLKVKEWSGVCRAQNIQGSNVVLTQNYYYHTLFQTLWSVAGKYEGCLIQKISPSAIWGLGRDRQLIRAPGGSRWCSLLGHCRERRCSYVVLWPLALTGIMANPMPAAWLLSESENNRKEVVNATLFPVLVISLVTHFPLRRKLI